jgi:hypothetical protein
VEQVLVIVTLVPAVTEEAERENVVVVTDAVVVEALALPHN